MANGVWNHNTGKTPMQLVWAENVTRKTNKPVLVMTPLAVSAQTQREAEKFEIEVNRSRDGKHSGGIVITNYERLHYFDPSEFAGVVCDESSAIKAFDGKRRKQVTRFLSKMPYRLLCTATAAPNDYIELGTSSEALGYLTQSEMLAMFFRSSDKQRHSLFREGDFWNRDKWFFRAHSQTPFWRWVCSWARALQKPEDLGCDGAAFILPELEIQQHIIESTWCPPGELFPRLAKTLREQRDERKRTMQERCEKVAELVKHGRSAVVWCQYNAEGDMLEKLIPDAVQVAGKDTDEDKEARLNAFTLGNERVLVTKPKVGAWGLNWQHCGHQVMFPSHSFEQYYQAIRRSWRFGRKNPVHVDIVTTSGESGVTANLQKKQDKATAMFASLVAEMNNEYLVKTENQHTQSLEVPPWL
ncbi:MAG: DEAD/DEAH box helicase [Chloroflexi bacterium]|nr:DEAD/DEAH box helicase [Chloroflexota bacterium]